MMVILPFRLDIPIKILMSLAEWHQQLLIPAMVNMQHQILIIELLEDQFMKQNIDFLRHYHQHTIS